MLLSVPSYLVPGTWLENLELMMDLGWIEGVELLFFSWDEDAKAILEREREAIAALSGRFAFSLHLPDPLGPGDESLVESTRDFVDSYVAHPPAGETVSGDWAGLLAGWRRRYGDDFLVEYTGASAFALAEAALPGLPLCADTGRILREGGDPGAWIAERQDRVREIHLHGLCGGLDHAAFAGDEAWLLTLVPALSAFPGRVNIEIFGLAGAQAGRRALAAALAGRQGRTS